MIYINTIKTAVYLFPFIALLLTAPYMLYEYRKYGAILILRTMIIYSFIFYLMTAYFMTILPLPSLESVSELTTPVMELRPFHAIELIFTDSPLVISDPSTYLATLTSNSFLQVFFNILLVVPFGVYLRYYYKRSLFETFIFSFLLSLSFELIQLSALFGIYPRPYRLFEIDDLIFNTLGGIIGYGLTPLFTFFLPSRNELDDIAYQKGQTVSIIRRLMAFGIDMMLAVILTYIIGNVLGHAGLIKSRFIPGLIIGLSVCFGNFILLNYLTKGYTFGKALLKIRLANTKDGHAPYFSELLIRYFLFGLIYVVIPGIMLYGLYYIAYMFINDKDGVKLYIVAITIVLAIYYLYQLMVTFVSLFIKEIKPAYIKYSHLENISMVKKKAL